MRTLLPLLLIIFCLGCRDDDSPSPATTERPNILLIIADDMGKDATNGFTEGFLKPNTPNIDDLRTNGLSFNNLWVNPTCSPTRASIITGKYGYRTEVKFAGDMLDASETTLQRYISTETDNAYATSIVGKWHLSGESANNANPESFGIDYYVGLIRGAVPDYYRWQQSEDGSTNLVNEYITTTFTDLSIEWLNNQDKPWFLWLAYNAPHTPFHAPPLEMHSQGDLPAYVDGLDPMPYYLAAIEAMDFQIGRLLDEIPNEALENTVIIFLGDNGSPNQVAQSPYASNRAKGSLYQGGINVPMYISGKGVIRRGEENSLINGTDLFATIAELAGVPGSEIHDSKSFSALLSDGQATGSREFQYSELEDGATDRWTISNGTYKLINSADGTQELYNLNNDPYENSDLLLSPLSAAAEAAKVSLEAELLTIRN